MSDFNIQAFNPRIPTPEELREANKPWAARIGPLLIDKWPEKLLALSMPTKFVPMPKGIAEDLFDSPVWTDAAKALAMEVDQALGFEHHFFRLNSRSPKDAMWPFQALITCSGKEVISVFRASERILDDLVHFEHTDLEPVICLREQAFGLRPEVELRCFLKGGKVLAVAEYGHEPTLWEPRDQDAALRERVERYVLDVVGPHLPTDTIVVDVWINQVSEYGFSLIEVNPYGMSDPVGAISYQAIEGGIPAIARHPLTGGKLDPRP